MRNLYLGLQGLAPPDMKLLKVFLRFAGRTQHHQWALALDEPEDLILRQTARPGDTLPMGLDPVVRAPVAWILGEGQDASDVGGLTLHRPLQMEPFAALLRAREAQIEAAALRKSASSASGRAPGQVVPLRDAPPPVARIAATAAPQLARAAQTAISVAAPPVLVAAFARLPASVSSIVDEPGVAYRLLKWPGTDLMRGQPKFVRMLAFLTHKPLSVQRLMVLSGIDEATCVTMLTQLDDRGLLARVDAHPETLPPPVENPPELAATVSTASVIPLPERPAPRASEPAQSGLFQRLRVRLGLR